MFKIIILQLTRMGDLVQTLPVLQSWKTADPGCHITLVCLSEFQSVVKSSLLWDSVIPIPIDDLNKLYADEAHAKPFAQEPFLSLEALKDHYQVAINLTSDLPSSLMMQGLSAEKKWGRVNAQEHEILLHGNWAKYLFSLVSHRMHNHFNLVDLYMGISSTSPKPMQNYLPQSDLDKQWAKNSLAQLNYTAAKPLIALQLGASHEHRTWGVENYAALAKKLIQELNCDILLLGDKSELASGFQFTAIMHTPCLNLIGQTSLTQLAAILTQCRLLISNDTGTIHIAAAVNTKALGLYFSTAYYCETAPYGEGHAILQTELPCSPCQKENLCEGMRCKSVLSVEAVFLATQYLFDNTAFKEWPFTELSFYQSRFLCNGTMAYEPVAGCKISSHYLWGYLNRLIWELIFDLPWDRDYVLNIFKRVSQSSRWDEIYSQVLVNLQELQNEFSFGKKISAQLMALFIQGGDRESILAKHGELQNLAHKLNCLGSEKNILADFFKYEMLDSKFLAYPEFATDLNKKYSKLLNYTENGIHALSSLFSP